MKKLLLLLLLLAVPGWAQQVYPPAAGVSTSTGTNNFTNVNSFLDNANFKVLGSVDNTKVLEFNLAGMTTANTILLPVSGTAALPVFGPAGGNSFAITGDVVTGNYNFLLNNAQTFGGCATCKIGFSSTAANGMAAGSTDDTFLQRGGTNGAFRVEGTAAPTVSSGFGTSPAVTASGANSLFQVNVGTGGTATSGVIAFNGTWTNAPFCVVNDETSQAITTTAVATTTTVTLTATAAWTASSKLDVHCFSN